MKQIYPVIMIAIILCGCSQKGKEGVGLIHREDPLPDSFTNLQVCGISPSAIPFSAENPDANLCFSDLRAGETCISDQTIPYYFSSIFGWLPYGNYYEDGYDPTLFLNFFLYPPIYRFQDKLIILSINGKVVLYDSSSFPDLKTIKELEIGGIPLKGYFNEKGGIVISQEGTNTFLTAFEWERGILSSISLEGKGYAFTTFLKNGTLYVITEDTAFIHLYAVNLSPSEKGECISARVSLRGTPTSLLFTDEYAFLVTVETYYSYYEELSSVLHIIELKEGGFEEKGEIKLDGYVGINQMYYREGTLFLFTSSYNSSSLNILNVKDPMNPRSEGTYYMAGTSYINWTAFSEKRIYAVGGEEEAYLFVFDISSMDKIRMRRVDEVLVDENTFVGIISDKLFIVSSSKVVLVNAENFDDFRILDRISLEAPFLPIFVRIYPDLKEAVISGEREYGEGGYILYVIEIGDEKLTVTGEFKSRERVISCLPADGCLIGWSSDSSAIFCSGRITSLDGTSGEYVSAFIGLNNNYGIEVLRKEEGYELAAVSLENMTSPVYRTSLPSFYYPQPLLLNIRNKVFVIEPSPSEINGEIFDFENPSSPSRSPFSISPGGHLYDLSLIGEDYILAKERDYDYYEAPTTAVRIYRASNGEIVYERIYDRGIAGPGSVQIGNHLYYMVNLVESVPDNYFFNEVTGPSFLEVLDVSTPSSPRGITSLNIPGSLLVDVEEGDPVRVYTMEFLFDSFLSKFYIVTLGNWKVEEIKSLDFDMGIWEMVGKDGILIVSLNQASEPENLSVTISHLDRNTLCEKERYIADGIILPVGEAKGKVLYAEVSIPYYYYGPFFTPQNFYETTPVLKLFDGITHYYIVEKETLLLSCAIENAAPYFYISPDGRFYVPCGYRGVEVVE